MPVMSGTSRRFMSSLRFRVGTALQLACVATIAPFAATACASSSPSSATSNGPKPGPNLITADEIARVNVQNAFEAVQKLRPSMLRQRQIASANGQGGLAKDVPPATGTSVSAGQLVVYMDNTRLGDVEQLRQIPASSVAALRYYSASEAQTKWGSGHPGGAIEVISKR